MTAQSSLKTTSIAEAHIVWISAALSCDGESVAVTAATQPSIEDLVSGALAGLPAVRLHNAVLAVENGGDFLSTFERAADGALGAPFILVVEGSIPNEALSGEGYFSGLGFDRRSGQPIKVTTWIDRLAPQAFAVVAVGTCASYGGVPAMMGNPTGAMGLPDYLGWKWRSRAGIPIVCVPGCPTQPDNMTEIFAYLLYQAQGKAPMIPLDAQLRPTWLYGQTAHESCDRGGYYESADFATAYGQRPCIVKLGCYGPVVNCNVPRRGWVGGVGGCPNVGGICIGCTMPGFPDKFMPFMEEPPGAKMSSTAVLMYGRTVRALRQFTQGQLNIEPEWRRPAQKPAGEA